MSKRAAASFFVRELAAKDVVHDEHHVRHTDLAVRVGSRTKKKSNVLCFIVVIDLFISQLLHSVLDWFEDSDSGRTSSMAGCEGF